MSIVKTFSGREFTEIDIDLIKEITRMYPGLSRKELAQTICENIEWQTHSGTYKYQQCKDFLEILSEEGIIKLPPKQIQRKHDRQLHDSKGFELPEPKGIEGEVKDIEPIELIIARAGVDLKRWRKYIDKYHILGDKYVFGSQLHYFIKAKDQELGCIQFSASSWALAKREEWIGWDLEDRKKRLHLIINNSRYLIFPWVKIKNLASKVLSLAAKQIQKDWLREYCYAPVMLETFVDIEKYKGTSYKAANWRYLGQTAGRGRMDKHHKNPVSPKAIYMYALEKDFRAYLKGEKPYKVVKPDE